jgi:glyoxalase family protein
VRSKFAYQRVTLKEVLLGLHHVTAFAGGAQINLDFYTQVMGLRLIKRTVNFDDPGTYHFYYGDDQGTPGALLTFFPWPTAPPGRAGTGQAAGVSLAVPKGSLDSWIKRLRDAKVHVEGPQVRFDEEFIAFRDPHGLLIEMFAAGDAIRLHSTTLCEADPEKTFTTLSLLGFNRVAECGDRTRFDLAGTPLDVLAMPGAEPGRISSGVVHHIAWRVADEPTQNAWRERLKKAGVHVTRVIDRQYFKSIYFREAGGVLFEIATDGPGFFVDEDVLGQSLKLPPWLEPIRDSIERRLPTLTGAVA